MKFLEQVKASNIEDRCLHYGGDSTFPALLRFKTKVLSLEPCLLWIQVLWTTHLLEASLMGFTLFLGLLIDRVHHYLQKLQTLRSSTGALKDEIRKLEEERARRKTEDKSSKQVKVLEEQISALTEKLKKLELESAEKDEKIETAEVHVQWLPSKNKRQRIRPLA